MIDQEREDAHARIVVAIQDLCEIGMYCDSACSRNKDKDYEWRDMRKKYVNIKERVLAMLSTISDEFYFSDACYMIIDMLIQAKEIEEAKELFQRVSVEIIRKEIFDNHPAIIGSA